MKNRNKLYLLLALVITVSLSSCFHYHDHDISFSVSDDEDEFQMDADYNRTRTHDVQVYLNDHLLNGKIKLMHNDHVNKEITLDDNTTFYINSEPGSVSIKIDKEKNSPEQCERIRMACEDLKEILADN